MTVAIQLHSTSIFTTVEKIPQEIRKLRVSPETTMQLIIAEYQDDKTTKTKKKKSYLPFLHSGTWDDKKGNTDITKNHDYYLYDLDNPHGN
jgi:hypothetical protein